MEIDRVPPIAKYLSIVFLVSWLGRSTVWNFLPIFIERHIASVFLVGVITSLPSLVPVILDIPAGNLVKRVGERLVIFMGLVSQVIPAAMYLTAMPAFIVLGKAMEGITKTLAWNGGWSLSLRSSSDDVESETVSIFVLGVNLAVIIGPVIGGFLITSYGFPLTFWLWMFSATLAIMVYYSYIGVEHEAGLEESLEELLHRKTYRDEFHHLKEHWSDLKFPYALVFLYSIIFSFYWLAIPLLLKNVSNDFTVMGMIFGIAALPKGFQFVFGDLADAFGRKKMVLLLSLGLTPVLLTMNFLSEVMVIGAAFFVARLLSSGMSPAIHAIFDEQVPDEVEAEMTGFLEFFKHVGHSIGPILAGAIASIWSINTSFLAAGFIAFLIFLLSGYGILKS